MSKKFRAKQDCTLSLTVKKGEQRGGNIIKVKKGQIIDHNEEFIPVNEEGVSLPKMPIGIFKKAARDDLLEEV